MGNEKWLPLTDETYEWKKKCEKFKIELEFYKKIDLHGLVDKLKSGGNNNNDFLNEDRLRDILEPLLNNNNFNNTSNTRPLSPTRTRQNMRNKMMTGSITSLHNTININDS